MRALFFTFALVLATPLAAATQARDPAQGGVPLRLLRTIPLPSIKGDFDHFGVDVQGNRMFLAAEEHHTIELFELSSGKPVRSIKGFQTPHSMLLLLDQNQIYVVDGGPDGGRSGAVRIMNSTTYAIEKSIDLKADADALSYDVVNHLLYVTNGGKEAHEGFSLITVIDTRKGEKTVDFKVQSANLEAMALQKDGSLLYVNARDKDQIAVLDRTTGAVKSTFQLESIKHNTPLYLDGALHRLLVVGRKPGRFGVLDSESGKELNVLAAGDDVDEMTYDPDTKRIYLACGEGFVEVFQQTDVDHY